MNYKHGFCSNDPVLNGDFSYALKLREKRLEMQCRLQYIFKTWWKPGGMRHLTEEDLHWANQILKERPEWAMEAIEWFEKMEKEAKAIPLCIPIKKEEHGS